MNRTAYRVSVTAARKAFADGQTIVVSADGHRPTVNVTPSTTVHTAATTVWSELADHVRTWSNRYPNQRYYVVFEPAAGDVVTVWNTGRAAIIRIATIDAAEIVDTDGEIFDRAEYVAERPTADVVAAQLSKEEHRRAIDAAKRDHAAALLAAGVDGVDWAADLMTPSTLADVTDATAAAADAANVNFNL